MISYNVSQLPYLRDVGCVSYSVRAFMIVLYQKIYRYRRLEKGTTEVMTISVETIPLRLVD